jgi:hypothetical protein
MERKFFVAILGAELAATGSRRPVSSQVHFATQQGRWQPPIDTKFGNGGNATN